MNTSQSMLNQNRAMNIAEGVLFTILFLVSQCSIICGARRNSQVWKTKGKQVLFVTQGVIGLGMFAYWTRIFAPRLQLMMWSHLTLFRMFWWASVLYVVHLHCRIPVAAAICMSVCAEILEAVWHIFVFLFATQVFSLENVPLFMMYNLLTMAGFLSQVAIFRLLAASAKSSVSFFEKGFKLSIFLLGFAALFFLSIPRDLGNIAWDLISFGVYDLLKQAILVQASFMTLEPDRQGSLFFSTGRPSDDPLTQDKPVDETKEEEEEIQTPIKPCLVFSSSFLEDTPKAILPRYSPKSHPAHSTSSFEFDRGDLTITGQKSKASQLSVDPSVDQNSQGSVADPDFVVRDSPPKPTSRTLEVPTVVPDDIPRKRTIRLPPPLKKDVPALPLIIPSPPPGSPSTHSAPPSPPSARLMQESNN